tara:strand:- start:428 stop:673 length:246 start_codon:yes stop_codon:yes gene_type:complete
MKQNRNLNDIASEIFESWGEKVNHHARPYLEAMTYVEKPNDKFGYDSADSIVRYFLSNANTWRGEDARRIKRELKDIVGIK